MFGMGKAGYTVRNASWLTFANYFVRGLGFVFVVFALRRFDAGGYGEYVLINNYTIVLSTFAGLGLTNLINAKVADSRENALLLPAYNLTSFLILAIACVVLRFAKPSFPLAILVLFCLSSGMTQVLYMRYFQNQLHKRWALIGLAQSTLAFGGMLIGMALGASLHGLFVINFGSKLASCLALWAWDGARLDGGPGLRLMRESYAAFFALLRRSGIWMVANVVANKLVSEAIPIFLGEGISLSFLGKYDLLLKIVSLFAAPIYAMESIVASRQTRATIHMLRKKHLPVITGISLALSCAAFLSVLLVYRFVLKADFDFGFVAAAAGFSLTVASLGHRLFNRATLTILERTHFLMMNNLVSTLLYVGGSFWIVRSASPQLYHVGLLELVASLASATMYEFNYRLADPERARPGRAVPGSARRAHC